MIPGRERPSSREQLQPLPGSPQVAPGAVDAAFDSRTTPRERQGSQTRLAPLPPVGTSTAALGSGRGDGSRPGSRGSGREEDTPVSPDALNPKIKYSKESLGLQDLPPGVPIPKFDTSRTPGINEPNAPTARGPVKWVPHTHANPKHAKFCFICLHGKLEGEKDGMEDVKQQQQDNDQDLPSPLEMKELGYLLSSPAGRAASEGTFRRAGADYQRNNISALWLREVSTRVYDETIKGMVAEQNVGIALGVDVKLVDDREDEQDRKALSRLFTMSDEENAKVEQDLEKMGEWCTGLEAKLMDVMPPPRPLGNLPQVEGPSDRQKELLEYQSLVDFSQLKGVTAEDAKIAMIEAEGFLGTSKGATKAGKSAIAAAADTFKAKDLQNPLTQPDMAEVQVVPYPLSTEDVPGYEPMNAMPPTRQPVDALTDPFQRPFLYLAEFHETVMPVFEGTSTYGTCRIALAVPAEEEWLTKTRSLFNDNNEPDEAAGWGMVPARKRVMPVLIDEPYVPPFDLVGAEGGSGMKLMMRSIWDPELFHTGGGMVPPLKERGRDLYQSVPVEHPDGPVWSKLLSPPHSREQKITDLIPTIPVKSFTRFRPKKVLVDMPDFLWDLVRDDAAGQGLWDVISQRHEVPMELEEEKKRQEQAKLKDLADEEAKVKQTLEMEQAALRAAGVTGDTSSQGTTPTASRPGTVGGSMTASTMPLPAGNATADATVPPASFPMLEEDRPALVEAASDLPKMEVEPPSTPQASAELPPAPSGGAPMGSPPRPKTQEQRPGELTQLGTSPGMGPASPPSAVTPSRTGMGMSTAVEVQDHMRRTQSLAQHGGEGRKVEELLADDRFIETLATKITKRLGDNDVGFMGSTATQGTFRPGGRSLAELSGGTALAGKPTMMKPDIPSFAEPTDGNSKAQLPRALQAGGSLAVKNNTATSADPTVPPQTNTDVNSFTQEKMRGDCYVRLLVHPDAASAKKAIIPYQGDMLNPDVRLVMGTNRPHLTVPPRPPYVNEEGELVEDDEFADFEKHDNVAFSFVRHNRFEAVEALMQQESEILQSRDVNGNNLLHVACQNDHRRIAKLLLKNGIAVNEQNNKGNTALHYCFQYNFMQLSDYLIAHGADETIANKAGLMPAQGTGVEDPIGVAQRNLQSGG